MKRNTVVAALALVLAGSLQVAFGEKLSEISDVRVAPLVQSHWTQKYFGGAPAFNLYTPNNHPIGCVTASFIQLMRFWQKPVMPVEADTEGCWVDGAPARLKMFGGVYDWNSMPLVDADCTEDFQRQALGRLAYDFSVASHTSFGPMSGTFSDLAAEALVDEFGYASARTYTFDLTNQVHRVNIGDREECRNAILASLDAGMPVTIGLVSDSGAAHQAIVDGYGYNGGDDIYCHLNFALSAENDGWYNLAIDDLAEGAFSAITDIVYNIHPEQEGDVISGRVLDADGNPVAGVAVSLSGPGAVAANVKTGANGIYAFRFTGKGNFTVTANDASLGRASRTVKIAKAGRSADIEFDEDDFSLSYGAEAVIANLWGVDLTLAVSNDIPAPSVYDGYFEKDGETVGTILAKVAKPNRRTGLSKVTASVILEGVARKLTYKGEMSEDGSATLSCNGQQDIALNFYTDEFSGSRGGVAISGVRNRWLSKDKAESSKAAEDLRPLLGSYNVAAAEGTLNVKIAAKGKAKVSGTLASGLKVSASAQLAAKDGEYVLPVAYNKKADGIAFMMKISADGKTVSVSGFTDADAGKADALESGAKFSIDTTDVLWNEFPGPVFVEYLPDGISVSQEGKKWIVAGGARPGKVAYLRGTQTIDEGKLGDNPSALKFSYKPATGAVSGSFKVYAAVNGKIKAYTMKLTGVLVGKTAHLVAAIKRPAGSISAVVGSGE